MNQTYQDGMDLDLQERPSNPMGLVGFILAFCLPPIGLVLSLIALAWRPRGFAIAGVIIGLITTTFVAVIGVGVVRGGQQLAMYGQLGTAIGTMQTSLASAQSADGKYPADLGAAGISAPNDPWGTPIAYQATGDGAGYLLTSAGPDKQMDTVDDVLADPTLEPDAIQFVGMGSGFAAMFGDEGKKGGRAMMDLVRLSIALEAHKTNTSLYPDTLDALPGMLPKAITDPWGNLYAYSVTKDGAAYSLSCNGPDGKPDTQDDFDAGDMRRGLRSGRAGSRTPTPTPPATPEPAPAGESDTKPAGAEEKK